MHNETAASLLSLLFFAKKLRIMNDFFQRCQEMAAVLNGELTHSAVYELVAQLLLMMMMMMMIVCRIIRCFRRILNIYWSEFVTILDISGRVSSENVRW